MRTTIAVNDHILESARQRARERGQTLGQVIEDALRRELTTQPNPVPPEIPVFRGGGGLRPGIDPTSNRSLLEAADEGVEFPHLR